MSMTIEMVIKMKTRRIKMQWIELFKQKVMNKVKNKNSFYQKIYSQTGEDIIVRNLLKLELGIEKVRYIDVGANDPRFLNNTYLLYLEGGVESL